MTRVNDAGYVPTTVSRHRDDGELCKDLQHANRVAARDVGSEGRSRFADAQPKARRKAGRS